jgi:hypothetical protein
MWRAILIAAVTVLSSSAFCATGTIIGTVVDEDGVPVSHIGVEACPADVGFDLILPRATTDEHGKFALRITFSRHDATDRWAVYAYDEEHDQKTGFYPRPSDFFGNKDARHSPVITISSRTPEATVEITLGPKAGALTGHVVGVEGRPVVPTFEFRRLSDPDKYDAFTFQNNSSPCRVLLPANTSLTLQVTAPGYKPWSPPNAISIGSGEEFELDIRLEPDAKVPPSAN